MLPHGFSKWTTWAGTRVVFHAWNSVEPATLVSDPPPTPPQTEAQKVVDSIVDGREKRTVETYSYPDFFAGSRHKDGVARVI